MESRAVRGYEEEVKWERPSPRRRPHARLGQAKAVHKVGSLVRLHRRDGG
jgi:hypothetical protein